jgi:CubicO group peptidase (beta-lactamase class C family)
MHLRSNWGFCLAALFAGFLAPSARPADDPLQGFDKYVQRALKDWDVPGLAVAIAQDDRMIFAEGFGVRKLGEPAKVDAKSLFAIASCSKSFTAAAIAKLVEEQKLRWDDKVIQHLPKFQLHDSLATREITIRDLLCHRSGLARHDLLWFETHNSRDDVLRRIQAAKPSTSFRSQFGYQNIMYLAAGQVVAAVTGKSWDDYVRETFFVPLGMKESCTSVNDLSRLTNVAQPHERIDDKVTPIAFRNRDNAGPAGSINSSVSEMTAWLRLHLNGGNFEKKYLLRPSSIREMHSPQMVIRTDGMGPEGARWRLMNPEAEFFTYGLGWIVKDYRGRKIVQHGGTLDGMRCTMAIVPSLKLGMVILSNRGGQYLPEALSYRIFDLFMGPDPKDWSAIFQSNQKLLETNQKLAQLQQEKDRKADTKPSLALEKYTGTYRDELYGDVVVSIKDGEMRLKYGDGYDGKLVHWHYDTFQAQWDEKRFNKELLTFVLDNRGSASELRWRDLAAMRTQSAK